MGDGGSRNPELTLGRVKPSIFGKGTRPSPTRGSFPELEGKEPQGLCSPRRGCAVLVAHHSGEAQVKIDPGCPRGSGGVISDRKRL